jgi:hypothetical protein
MRIPPLDEETYEACQILARGARFHGFDLFEQMHAEQLIASPWLMTKIQLEAINTLITMLQDAKPHELLRRKFKAGAACTPDDMVVAILDFIQEYREMIKKDGP